MLEVHLRAKAVTLVAVRFRVKLPRLVIGRLKHAGISCQMNDSTIPFPISSPQSLPLLISFVSWADRCRGCFPFPFLSLPFLASYPSLLPVPPSPLSASPTMAIFPPQTTTPRISSRDAQLVDIEAWTEEATASLWRVTISPELPVRGTFVPLAIPLDEQPQPAQRPNADNGNGDTSEGPNTPRRKLLRRDSLDRRNALLKGKEGSRRRQRWENGSCLLLPSHSIGCVARSFITFSLPA